MRVYDTARLGVTELLLHDVLLELRKLTKAIEPVDLSKGVPLVDPPLPKPKGKVCKYCGDIHSNKGVALNCAKKHKNGEDVTL